MIKMVAYRYCDICRQTDPAAEVPAVDSIRWNDGSKPLRVDVCADHSDPTWQTMTAAAIPDLERSKDVAKRAAAAPARVAASNGNGKVQHNDPGTCPVCGDHFEWLSTHISSKHKLKPAAARGGKLSCPVCGETRDNTASLARHTMDEHGQRLMHVLADQAAR